MAKISANMIFWKWIDPILVICFSSYVIGHILLSKSYQHRIVVLLILCWILVLGIFLYIRLVKNMMSYVYDKGDYLILKNGKVTDKVMYSNIKEVEYLARQAPRKVVLHLIHPSKFGKKISFSPYAPLSEFFSERNTIVEMLIEKVENSRNS